MLVSQIVFITGTSTGVGKTVATGALLYILRHRGVRALALKPFCTGSRSDVRHLRRLQANELDLQAINPFFYSRPLAPYVAARGRTPSLRQVVQHINRFRNQCELLLVEGAGGLLVPLGNNYSAADIISALSCRVLVVAPNKLGTLNHTLLTLKALPTRGVTVLLMGQRRPDLASRSNASVLRQLLKPTKVLELKFLGRKPLSATALKTNRPAMERVARQLIPWKEIRVELAAERA